MNLTHRTNECVVWLVGVNNNNYKTNVIDDDDDHKALF